MALDVVRLHRSSPVLVSPAYDRVNSPWGPAVDMCYSEGDVSARLVNREIEPTVSSRSLGSGEPSYLDELITALETFVSSVGAERDWVL